jgi:hypothetical protein
MEVQPMATIHALSGGMRSAPANAALVSILQCLLTEAKAGRLQGLFAAALDLDVFAFPVVEHRDLKALDTMIGALEREKLLRLLTPHD